LILAFRLNMELLEKFYSFFLIINYNEQALIEKRNFIFFADFLFFSVFFFLQLTLFYWKIVIKIANLSREIFFFKGFIPLFFLYFLFFNLIFDLVWYCYLFFTITALVFFSFPYFVYNYIKKKPKLEISEKMYKMTLIFFLIIGNRFKNFFFFLIMILVFEFLRALKCYW
jgi:hypothetical protein